jgi:voltage-gated potassium channel
MMPGEKPAAKETTAPVRARVTVRRRTYKILEIGTIGDWAGTVVGRTIVALVILNLVAITLESVPNLAARYSAVFSAIEVVSLVVFSIEYGLRVWAAVEHPLGQQIPPWKARLRFALSPHGIVDAGVLN